MHGGGGELHPLYPLVPASEPVSSVLSLRQRGWLSHVPGYPELYTDCVEYRVINPDHVALCQLTFFITSTVDNRLLRRMAISFSRPVYKPEHRLQAPAGSAHSQVSADVLSPASQQLLLSLFELHQVLQGLHVDGGMLPPEVTQSSARPRPSAIEDHPEICSVPDRKLEDPEEVCRVPDRKPELTESQLCATGLSAPQCIRVKEEEVANMLNGSASCSVHDLTEGVGAEWPKTAAKSLGDQLCLPDIVLSCLRPSSRDAGPDLLVTSQPRTCSLRLETRSNLAASPHKHRSSESGSLSKPKNLKALQTAPVSFAIRKSDKQAEDIEDSVEDDEDVLENEELEEERMSLADPCDWRLVGARLKTIADHFQGDQVDHRRRPDTRTRRRPEDRGPANHLLQLVTRLSVMILVKKLSDLLQ